MLLFQFIIVLLTGVFAWNGLNAQASKGFKNRTFTPEEQMPPYPGDSLDQFIAVGDVNFEEEVKESDLPVLFIMWSRDCSKCLEYSVLENEFSGRIKFVKAYYETNKEILKRMKTQVAPSIFILKKGKIRDRIAPNTSVEMLRNILNEWAK